MKYIVVGPTIVNDILLADGSKKEQVLGGSIYCVAGIKLWCDDCLFISNVGDDFKLYYGKWMRDNNCTAKGLRFILPRTWYTLLTYGDKGLHSEVSIYGKAEEELLSRIDVIDAEQIAACCSPDTRGIYIEANEKASLWSKINLIRSVCGAKIMWEIPTSAAMDPIRRPDVLRTIQETDIYSLNLPEARSLFNTVTEQDTLSAIILQGKPCFFRVGKRGAYIVEDGVAYFEPSVNIGKIVDTTGCGNASTAAALYGLCEGFAPRKTARLANISAAYNLLQYGPYPAVTETERKEAQELLKQSSI